MSKFKYEVKRGLAYYFFEGQKNKNVNVVFIHGTGCNKDFLVATKSVLTDYNVYYFDLPGHGDSENTGYSLKNYLDAIEDFVSDIPNVILVGHSLGGALTVGALARKPKSVIGGIPVGGALDFSYLPKDFVDGVHNGVINKELVFAGFGHQDNQEVLDSIAAMEPDKVTLEDWLIDEKLDVSAGVENITVPTKVLVGRDDSLVPVSKSDEIAQRIPDASLVIVNKGFHMAVVAYKQYIKYLVDEIVEETGFSI